MTKGRTAPVKESKKKAVKEIREKINSSKILILTDYRGMTVKQVTELRRKLRANKAEYKVFKNTLVAKALPEGLSSLGTQLIGQVAIIFGSDEVVMPAKTLMQFIGEHEKPGLLVGVVENQIYADKQIKELAKLPSKQELLSKVVGAMKSPLYNIVSVMQGPLRKFVYALDEIRKQKSQGGEK
ncbi:50S ribosomal protein L10 [Candidatus Saganbacteria bacterium]|nr:50S ribosomal protein L10 [Candidatus Saganbacteria bacterium]